MNSIIISHINRIIQFFILTIFLVTISAAIMFNYHINYINAQMNNNISEYKEVDVEQLCKLSECIKVDIIVKNTYREYIMIDDILLYNKTHIEDTKYHLFNTLYISDNYELSIFNKASNTFYFIDSRLLDNYLVVFVIFVSIIFIFFIIYIYITVKSEKKESILLNKGFEALITNKSMIMITENIHHELNTPLEVIDNKVAKIHNIINKYKMNEIENDRRKNNIEYSMIDEDFEYIKIASEQIYTVLSKMSNFKNLRYSNGNKSLYDIIDGAFKIIKVINSNFEFMIDEDFVNYGLKNIKNADLLSIIINHIKNSIEASASKVYILINNVEDDTLKFRIIDNGNGIEEKIKKNVFLPNFSTKKEVDEVRGNGMYLNKNILQAGSGDVDIISSSKKGTTIEIKIKIKKR